MPLAPRRSALNSIAPLSPPFISQCGVIGSPNAHAIKLTVTSADEFLTPFDDSVFRLVSTANVDNGFPTYKLRYNHGLGPTTFSGFSSPGCNPADLIYYSPSLQGWFLGDGGVGGAEDCVPTFGLHGLNNLTDATTGAQAGTFKIWCTTATATATGEYL